MANFDFTVGKLRRIIQDLPDDMPVGRRGHFGFLIEAYGAEVSIAGIYDGQGVSSEFFRAYNESERKRVGKIEYLDLQVPDIQPLED